MSENEKNVPKRRFKEFEKAEAWKQRKLGDLADIVRGASPRPIQDPKWFDDKSTIGWLRISDVSEQDGRIYFLEQHISKAGQEKTRVLMQSHLLLSIAASVGKPVINYISTGVHDGFLIFQNPTFDQEFMFQWMKMFEGQWQKYGQPGSQVNLNSDIVKNQVILIPKEEEQVKIGTFFSDIDNLITLHQRELEKMKSLKKAYLTDMFPAEGELKPKLRFAGFTDDWEQRKLGKLYSFQYGQFNNNPSNGGEYPVFGANGIIGGYTEYNSENSVIIGHMGEYAGSVLWGEGKHFVTYNGTIARSNENELESKFGYYMLYRLDIRKTCGGSGLPFLSYDMLEKMDGIFPKDKKEQECISKFLVRLDNLITCHQRKLEKLKNIKKAYLNEMFI